MLAKYEIIAIRTGLRTDSMSNPQSEPMGRPQLEVEGWGGND
jgi:hypothetical protein